MGDQVERRGLQVLVVDDYADAREMVVLILESAGFAARAASNGAAALASARQHCPDAVVLDIFMPDMDGIETARQFEADAALRGVPLIAYTARADTLRLPMELFAALCVKPCPT
jgi:CheY-like chemotaxis protein